MPSVDQTIAALRDVANRADEEKPDFRPAVGVVNDAGRIIATEPAPEIRRLQAAIASVRERLDNAGGVHRRPSEALRGPASHTFLAGGLWASNELTGSYLQALKVAQERVHGHSERATLRMQLLDWLRTVELGTPGQFFARLEATGNAPRSDQVSRAIGDLLRDGMVQEVTGPPGADRRNRFLALTSVADQSPGREEAMAVAVDAARHVAKLVGGWAKTRAVFEEAFLNVKVAEETPPG